MKNKKTKQSRSKRTYFLFFLLGILLTAIVYSNVLIFTGKLGSSTSPVKAELESVLSGNQNFGSQTITQGQYSLISRTVPIVAVNQDQSQGFVGNLSVRLIPGNGHVLVDTNPFLEPDLQYSANTAVAYAKQKTGNTAENYDFVLDYQMDSQVVGGGSAGAAATLASIAVLTGKEIRPDVAITGTINQDGSIGPIGGLVEKAKAVADAGYKIFLIPESQSTVTYYQQVVNQRRLGAGFVMYNTRYVQKTIDLKEQAKEWNLTIIEVKNIDEAMALMLK